MSELHQIERADISSEDCNQVQPHATPPASGPSANGPLQVKTGLRAGRRSGDKDDSGPIIIIGRDGP